MNNIQQKAQYDYRFEVGLSDLNYLHALSEVGIEFVITSYSIHYTKLYDGAAAAWSK